jgi:hypothetical protein
MDIGVEYKRGQNQAANRKWERVVWQPVGGREMIMILAAGGE